MRPALSPPNVLTYIRIGLTPLVVQLILWNRCGSALAVIAIAGGTDGIDGFLARRYQWSTRLGAYLDPIADKLLLTSVYLCLGFTSLVPSSLVWLILARDAAILSMSAAALAFTNFRIFPPTRLGKLSTFLQIVLALLVLGRCGLPPAIPAEAVTAGIWTTAAATAGSGIQYVARGVRMFLTCKGVLPGRESR
ncbi:MAG: CDP-alcohol phosphatidyltransferase family protein [Bryobacteraceae bacterium]